MNRVFKVNPIYKITFWNVYSRVRKNVARTTNSAEAWHRTLNFRNQVAHPNIAQLINEILNEEIKHEFDIARATAGLIILGKS